MTHLTRLADRGYVTSYGPGTFRFRDSVVAGSILILASGVYSWPVGSVSDLDAAAVMRDIGTEAAAGFFLFGTGPVQIFPSFEVRTAFMDAGISLEPMSTPAACRTLNVLLSEQRDFAAGLIAI